MQINNPAIKEVKFIASFPQTFEVLYDVKDEEYLLLMDTPSEIDILETILGADLIAIEDLNKDGANALEYGRFEVSLIGEDAGTTIFYCDSYDLQKT